MCDITVEQMCIFNILNCHDQDLPSEIHFYPFYSHLVNAVDLLDGCMLLNFHSYNDICIPEHYSFNSVGISEPVRPASKLFAVSSLMTPRVE